MANEDPDPEEGKTSPNEDIIEVRKETRLKG
jgi:hypothetical protein